MAKSTDTRLDTALSWPKHRNWAPIASDQTSAPNSYWPQHFAEMAAQLSDPERSEVLQQLEKQTSSKDGGAWVSSFKEQIQTAFSESATTNSAGSLAVGGRVASGSDTCAQTNSPVELGQSRLLAGSCVAVKDLIAVKGLKLSAGSEIRSDAPQEQQNAPIVEALQKLGATIAGTVALHEFAFGVTGVNHHSGTPQNPNAPGHIPGGSSSGSATAVADGSAKLAIGTDTGGSVRIPAALCGVVGFKPSYGRYPSQGVFPLSPTLDHVGLLCKDLDLIAKVDIALSEIGEIAPARCAGCEAASNHKDPHGKAANSIGRNDIDTNSRAERKLRIGFNRDELDSSDSEVRLAVTKALQELQSHGHSIEELPPVDGDQVWAASTAIMFSQAAAVHQANCEGGSFEARLSRYAPQVAQRLRFGQTLSSAHIAKAFLLRDELRSFMQAQLDSFELIVGPTVPIVAPPLEKADDADLPAKLVAHTRLGNVVGLGAVSIPLANTKLPVGLQLTARCDRCLLEKTSQLLAQLALV